MTLSGSHGTTATRVKSIQRLGWHDGTGRVGRGVYFWQESEFFVILAIGWFKQKLAEKRFRDDADKSCRVIIVDIEAEENEILNFDDRQLRLKVYELAQNRCLSQTSNRDIARAFNLFIDELEAETGIRYKIVTAEVPAPKMEYCPEYPTKIVGLPVCYAVREPEGLDITEVMICGEGN